MQQVIDKAKSNRRPTIQINDGRSFKNIYQELLSVLLEINSYHH